MSTPVPTRCMKLAEGDADPVDAEALEGGPGDGEGELGVDGDAEAEGELGTLDGDRVAESRREREGAVEVEAGAVGGDVQRPAHVDGGLALQVVEAGQDRQRAAGVAGPHAVLVGAEGELRAEGDVTDGQVLEAEGDRAEVPGPDPALAQRLDGDGEGEDVVLGRRGRADRRPAEADQRGEGQRAHGGEVDAAGDGHVEGVEVLVVGEVERDAGDVEGDDPAQAEGLQQSPGGHVDGGGPPGAVAVEVQVGEGHPEAVQRGHRGRGGGDGEDGAGRPGAEGQVHLGGGDVDGVADAGGQRAGVQGEAAVGGEGAR